MAFQLFNFAWTKNCNWNNNARYVLGSIVDIADQAIEDFEYLLSVVLG
jgi:hypothetical protein